MKKWLFALPMVSVLAFSVMTLTSTPAQAELINPTGCCAYICGLNPQCIFDCLSFGWCG